MNATTTKRNAVSDEIEHLLTHYETVVRPTLARAIGESAIHTTALAARLRNAISIRNRVPFLRSALLTLETTGHVPELLVADHDLPGGHFYGEETLTRDGLPHPAPRA